MQLDILIVGVLFPAIPLMMINFGNRYSLLAGLIRSLHDTVINAQTPADDSSRFFQQIASLRQRLRLLAVIQTFSAGAFILNLSAMISLYLNISDAGSWLFFCAIILMIMSMILFTLEIQIANSALDVHLSDLKKHQEWKDYIERKKSRRKSASKASSDQSPS
jgi:uncharacterized membrane protein (DUF485 family)